MKRMLLVALIGGASLSACAQAPQSPAAAQAQASAGAKPAAAGGDKAAEAQVRQALKTLLPQAQVDYVGPAQLPGFREVLVGGQLVYVSDDGKYLMQGSVIDLARQQDITQSSPALAKYRVDLLDSVPVSDRIVFAPPNPKYTISVFTDVECGYCRKLHSQIAEYNREGIAVQYLAFPRMGLGSQDHKDMISVWCAADRKQALTAAKSDRPISAKDCKNPVASEYELGQRLGITGTPAIFAADGTQIGGYLPPAQMRAVLDGLGSKAGGSR